MCPFNLGKENVKIEVVPSSVISKHIDIAEVLAAGVVILGFLTLVSPQWCYNPLGVQDTRKENLDCFSAVKV